MGCLRQPILWGRRGDWGFGGVDDLDLAAGVGEERADQVGNGLVGDVPFDPGGAGLLERGLLAHGFLEKVWNLDLHGEPVRRRLERAGKIVHRALHASVLGVEQDAVGGAVAVEFDETAALQLLLQPPDIEGSKAVAAASVIAMPLAQARPLPPRIDNIEQRLSS